MDHLNVLFMVRVCNAVLSVMLSCLFIVALWSPAGKGLTSWLSCMLCYLCFATFPCGVLGQVWYLIVFYATWKCSNHCSDADTS